MMVNGNRKNEGLPLIRYLAKHAVLGAAVGLVLSCLALWQVDLLHKLVFDGEWPLLASFMLISVFIVTFAGFAMMTGVMLIPGDAWKALPPEDQVQKPLPPRDDSTMDKDGRDTDKPV